jgi:hypothetical protein
MKLQGRVRKNAKSQIPRITQIIRVIREIRGFRAILRYSPLRVSMPTISLSRTLSRFVAATAVIILALLLAPSADASSDFLASLPVFSDFNNNYQLDLAELSSHGSHKEIHVGFEKSSWRTLTFDSGGLDPGRLFSRDIDRDGAADLIWLSLAASPEIVFWMGDGHGNFTFITDPAMQSWLTQEVLHRSDSWVPIDKTVDNELDGLISDDGGDALQTSGDWEPHLVSARNLTRLQTVSTVSSPFLSVLRKRGPPSIAHQ